MFSLNSLSTLVYRDITPRGAVILIIDFGTEPRPLLNDDCCTPVALMEREVASWLCVVFGVAASIYIFRRSPIVRA